MDILIMCFKFNIVKIIHLFIHLLIFAEKQTTSETQKSVQCGTWTKHADGGIFTSPNYPSKYPPDRECIYIIEGEGSPSEIVAFLGTNSC